MVKYLANYGGFNFFLYFAPLKMALRIVMFTGEMAEWSKAHAWKVCIPHKGIVGSNPTLSACIF